MELRHLRYFVAVVEGGSFTRAAQALSIAQPPLSRQIRDLEHELGTPLLVRHRHGVSLTPAGDALLREARALLAHADRLKGPLLAREAADRKPLALGFIPSASHFVLRQVLPAMQQRHPERVVHAREMLSTEQLAALQTGALDVALCRPPVHAKALTVAARLDDPFVLAMPRSHPLAGTGDVQLQAAAQADFVSFKRDEARGFFDQTLNFCTEAGFTPSIRCEAGTVFAVLHLVAAGIGVAIVPSSCATAADAGVVMRRIIRPARPGALLLVRRRADRDPLVAELVASMKTAFTSLGVAVARQLHGG